MVIAPFRGKGATQRATPVHVEAKGNAIRIYKKKEPPSAVMVWSKFALASISYRGYEGVGHRDEVGGNVLLLVCYIPIFVLVQ